MCLKDEIQLLLQMAKPSQLQYVGIATQLVVEDSFEDDGYFLTHLLLITNNLGFTVSKLTVHPDLRCLVICFLPT